MKHILSFIALAGCLSLSAGAQQLPSPAEVRAVAEALIAKVNTREVEAQVTFLHPEAVITWHNAEVSRGPAAVREFIERTLYGPTKFATHYKAEVKIDDVRVTSAETALAYGSAQEHMILATGRQLDFTGRWTATFAKADGRWLVRSLHLSTNMFDNTLLNQMKGALTWIGGGSLIFGAFVGWVIGRRGAQGRR